MAVVDQVTRMRLSRMRGCVIAPEGAGVRANGVAGGEGRLRSSPSGRRAVSIGSEKVFSLPGVGPDLAGEPPEASGRVGEPRYSGAGIPVQVVFRPRIQGL